MVLYKNSLSEQLFNNYDVFAINLTSSSVKQPPSVYFVNNLSLY